MHRFFGRFAFSVNPILATLFGGVILLLPIFFLPFTAERLTVAKESFLFLVLVVSLVFLVVQIGQGRQLIWYRSILDLPMMFLLFLVIGLIAFSSSPSLSVFGRMSEFLNTGISCILLLLFAWLCLQQLAKSEAPRNFLFLFLLGGSLTSLLFLLGGIPFVMNFFVHSLGVDQFTFNLVGNGASEIGVFLVALQLIALSILVSPRTSVSFRVLSLCAVFVSEVGLFSIGFSFLWGLLSGGLFSILILGFFLINSLRRSGVFLAFFLFLISIFCFIFGTPALFTRQLPSEVALGFGPSLAITESTLLTTPKNLFLGTGPGTFLYNFSLHRPIEFNTDPLVWSVRFTRPFNTVLSMLSEFGLVFTILFVLIILLTTSVFVVGLRRVWHQTKRTLKIFSTHTDTDVQIESLFLFVPWLVLIGGMWLVFFSFTLWFTWWFLTVWLVVGLGKGSHAFLREKKLQWHLSSQQSLLFAFVGIFLSTGVLVFGAFVIRAYIAEVMFTRAVDELNPFLAEPLLVKATTLYPRYAPYQNALARTYLEQARNLSMDEKQTEVVVQRLALAANTAKTATELEPKNVEYFDTLLTMYLNAQVFVPEANRFAKEAAIQAIQLEPTNPILFAKLGNVLHKEGDFAQAEKNYQTVLRLKPDYVPVYFDLAQLYEDHKQDEQAIAVYQEALKIVPDSAEMWYQLGRIFYNRHEGNDRAQSETAWLKVVELDPNYSNALYSLGLLYEDRGEVARAIGYFQRVRELNPQNDDVRKKLQSLLQG